jgi:hypothetical protein
LSHRLQTIAAIASLALCAAATTARADDASDARAIVNAVAARTISVQAYTADLSLHVQMHSFPFIGASFNGNTAYQRPGKYVVTLHTLPAIAKAFAKVSGDAGDPSTWQKRYEISIDRTAAAPLGQTALRLTPKEQCQVTFAEAYVDTATLTVQRIEWHYASGGRIDVDEHYTTQSGVLLADGQTAEIVMPGIHATASAALSNIVLQTDVASVGAALKR